MEHFLLFLLNSIVLGGFSSVYLLAKKIHAVHLSPAITYYLSFFLLLAYLFPVGTFLPIASRYIIHEDHKILTLTVMEAETIHHYSASHSFTIGLQVAVILWFCVAAWITFQVIYKHIIFMKTIKRWKHTTKLSDASMKRVPIFSCSVVSAPILTGFINRQLLIPENTDIAKTLDLICLHERIHNKRNDIILKAIAVSVGIINWFNPAVWFLIKDFLTDCELSCDLIAKQDMSPDNIRQYCELLLSFAKKQTAISVLTIGFSKDSQLLEKRIRLLLQNSIHPFRTLAFTICTLLIWGMITFSFSGISAEKHTNNHGQLLPAMTDSEPEKRSQMPMIVYSSDEGQGVLLLDDDGNATIDQVPVHVSYE